MDPNELNIPSSVNDPHYRYKMPKIQVAVQGSGNGIKTKWINLVEVSNALKVPTEYPLKFIGRELGSNTEIKSNVYLINGNHTVEKMQEVLDKFIKKYVICPKCKLPEIHGKITVKKDKGQIMCVCRSCGTLSKLDSTHDFAAYIKRSPPPYEEDKTGGSGGVVKKEGKKTFDSSVKKNIKACSDKLASLTFNDNYEEGINSIKSILNEYNFPTDIKYYVLANGLFDQKIYTNSFLKKIPLMNHFITNEKENSEEALFFFLIGLGDYIYARQAGKNSKYLPSVLYYLYKGDIISEEYWKNYAINHKYQNYNSILINKENENTFLTGAADFTQWIERGLYEGEEEKVQEEINIDDI